MTLKQIVAEDFISNLIKVSQEDNSTKKIINLIVKQASNPSLVSNYTISSVEAKDFLFGRLFEVAFVETDGTYDALVYHDHSS
jgi:hypothetical protein